MTPTAEPGGGGSRLGPIAAAATVGGVGQFDEAEFVAAGLFDPDRDANTGRRELLQWLIEMGFSLDEMVDAEARLALAAAAGDRRLVPGPHLSAAESVERSGLSSELFDALATAIGFAPIDAAPIDELGLTPAEVDALSTLGALIGTFTESEAIAFVRMLGASLARLGEAAVSLFLADIEGPHLLAGQSEYELARKVFDSVGLLDELTPQLDPLLRRHVLQAIERSRVTTIAETERMQYRYAIGFVDLVGFTEMSGSMAPDALASFLQTFEATAFDVASEKGARVVKFIGDEVMFVATDAGRACATAQALVSRFTSDGVVPRGGVAFGPVLLRGGDYFGRVVNLASRLVDDAVPGEILVTDELAASAPECSFESAGRRQVKGFREPVRVHTLLS